MGSSEQLSVVELFAGACSFSNAAKECGHRTFTTDWKAYKDIDHVADIMDIKRSDLPSKVDVIWAGLDCTTYSIASCSTHRQYINGVPAPKSEKAIFADKVAHKLLEVIGWYPEAKYFIENPRGLLKKMPFMQGGGTA